MTDTTFFTYKGNHCSCHECQAYRMGRVDMLRDIVIGAAWTREWTNDYDLHCAMEYVVDDTLEALVLLGDQEARGIVGRLERERAERRRPKVQWDGGMP